MLVEEFAAQQQGRYKWLVVGLLWSACFLNYADRQAIFALFPLLRESFGVNDVQLALTGTSFMWTYAAFGPLAGWLGDRYRRKTVIVCGILVWLAGTVLTVAARNYTELVVLRALSGLAEAVYFPAAMSLISGYHGPETRSRAMALHQSAVYAGTVGGGVFASWIGEWLGWRVNFECFAALGVVVLAIVLRWLREPPRSHTTTITLAEAGLSLAAGWSELLSSGRVLCLIGAFIGANFVAMSFMVWLPTFLFRKFHLSLAMSGVHATVSLAAAAACGVLLGGVAADRWAHRRRDARMRIQAFGALFGAPFLIGSGWAPSLLWVIVAMSGFGFCKGLYESNLWASLYDVVPVELRASAVGLMNSLGWLGGALAPLAIAAAAAHVSMSVSLSATGLIYLLVAALLLWNAARMRAS